jgi:hypothetical protein
VARPESSKGVPRHAFAGAAHRVLSLSGFFSGGGLRAGRVPVPKPLCEGPCMTDITRILSAIEHGDAHAAEQ